MSTVAQGIARARGRMSLAWSSVWHIARPLLDLRGDQHCQQDGKITCNKSAIIPRWFSHAVAERAMGGGAIRMEGGEHLHGDKLGYQIHAHPILSKIAIANQKNLNTAVSSLETLERGRHTIPGEYGRLGSNPIAATQSAKSCEMVALVSWQR